MDVEKVNRIGIQSITHHMPMWLDNMRENFARIKDDDDILDAEGIGRALVIGAGPSLHRNKHLELLADRGFDGTIVACDRVMIDCLEYGIVPDYVLFLDGAIKALPFVDAKIVDEYSDRITAVMSCTTHPAVVKRWGGKILWFVNSIPNAMVANVSHVWYGLTKKTGLATAGHVGAACWSFAFRLGCREMYLIGIDLAEMDDAPPEVEETYVMCSLGQVEAAGERGCKIINCTEGGALTGDTIEQRRLKDVLG